MMSIWVAKFLIAQGGFDSLTTTQWPVIILTTVFVLGLFFISQYHSKLDFLPDILIDLAKVIFPESYDYKNLLPIKRKVFPTEIPVKLDSQYSSTSNSKLITDENILLGKQNASYSKFLQASISSKSFEIGTLTFLVFGGAGIFISQMNVLVDGLGNNYVYGNLGNKYLVSTPPSSNAGSDKLFLNNKAQTRRTVASSFGFKQVSMPNDIVNINSDSFVYRRLMLNLSTSEFANLIPTSIELEWYDLGPSS